MKNFPTLRNVKYSIAAVISLFFLCGCQPPIVPVKNVRYSVSYSFDGKEFQISTTYKCYYEDIAWISERGPDWHISGDQYDPMRITGTFPDGTKYVAQPVDSKVRGFFPEYRCPDVETPVASEIFVVSKDHPGNLDSFDDIRIKSKNHVIKINKSVISLDSESHGLYSGFFKKSTKNINLTDHGRFYYTIGAKFISGNEIDKDGLRDYVTWRKSIWLENGKRVPFISWGNEDVEAARNFLEKKSYLYYPNKGIEIAGDHIEQAWTFDQKGSTNSISWVPLNITNQFEPMIPDGNLPKDLIKFENSEIEIPTLKYLGLHFYDPSTDTITIFYMIKAQVIVPSPSGQTGWLCSLTLGHFCEK